LFINSLFLIYQSIHKKIVINSELKKPDPFETGERCIIKCICIDMFFFLTLKRYYIKTKKI